jgi:hypothetical protein
MKKLFIILTVVAFTAVHVSNVYATNHKGKPKSHQTVTNTKKSSATEAKAIVNSAVKSPSSANQVIKKDHSKTTNCKMTNTKCEKNHSCCKANKDKSTSEKKGK